MTVAATITAPISTMRMACARMGPAGSPARRRRTRPRKASPHMKTMAIVFMCGLAFLGRVRRRRAGLPAGPMRAQAIRIVLIGAVIVAALVIFNRDRGLPLAVLIVVGLALAFVYLTEQTRFGRHVFAVGGNAEAARRAGIRIDR